MCLLTYHMTAPDAGEFITLLKLRRTHARAIEDVLRIKKDTPALDAPRMKPSEVHALLSGRCPVSIEAVRIAAGSPRVKRRLAAYAERLSKVRTVLNGEDLKKMGFTPGPQIKQTLEKLLQARLDGRISDEQSERRLAEGVRDRLPGN
jgi:tRNA nucleotidyltransferase (CCA-adding enzyme)